MYRYRLLPLPIGAAAMPFMKTVHFFLDSFTYICRARSSPSLRANISQDIAAFKEGLPASDAVKLMAEDGNNEALIVSILSLSSSCQIFPPARFAMRVLHAATHSLLLDYYYYEVLLLLLLLLPPRNLPGINY